MQSQDKSQGHQGHYPCCERSDRHDEGCGEPLTWVPLMDTLLALHATKKALNETTAELTSIKKMSNNWWAERNEYKALVKAAALLIDAKLYYEAYRLLERR